MEFWFFLAKKENKKLFNKKIIVYLSILYKKKKLENRKKKNLASRNLPTLQLLFSQTFTALVFRRSSSTLFWQESP